MFENNIFSAHITFNDNLRPCPFVFMVLISTCKRNLLKFLLVIKATIMSAISNFPRNVPFLGIFRFQFTRTNRTTFIHALSPLPNVSVVSPKSVFNDTLLSAKAYLLFLEVSSTLTHPLAVKTRIVEETLLGEQPVLNQSVK